MSIKAPVVTEKAAKELNDNKYIFYIEKDVNKIEVRKEIEKQFNVKVKSVNICVLPGKKRRRGRITGMTSQRKKAIVTLCKGQSIEELKKLF